MPGPVELNPNHYKTDPPDLATAYAEIVQDLTVDDSFVRWNGVRW